MSTVGYGDEVPGTYLGRSFTILCCFMGNFTLQLLELTLLIEFETLRSEQQFYDFINGVNGKFGIKNNAAVVI